MDGTQAGTAPGAPQLRVRHQARDALVVMVFSAAASGVCSLLFLLLLGLGE
ncbi:hypothetical protein IEQ44_01030 [Nocardioides sp. Y6]|uniref:Uncharacterized protein n=1 Tax=Nocardioides malaquae TaxID=2773426 RepID=A0ABR9RNT8_9ACTN|nr:hypothetical protein [Nocardioides malaquae]MBE7323234.1 hypothetical protein [Nocardioides malaquae]